MTHPIHRVSSFEIAGPYTLRVSFEDQSERTIDFRPILAGELFGVLRDIELFNQVRIDPEVNTLVWPNGADFDPATLHDWPSHERHFGKWRGDGTPCRRRLVPWRTFGRKPIAGPRQIDDRQS